MDAAEITTFLIDLVNKGLIPLVAQERRNFIEQNNISSADYLYTLPAEQKGALLQKFYAHTLPTAKVFAHSRLHEILPEAEMWETNFSANQPINNCCIVGIHTPLLDNNVISIAVQQEGRTVAAVLWNSIQGIIYFAEDEVDGAAVIEKDGSVRELMVEETPLSENSTYMYLLPEFMHLPVEEMESAPYMQFTKKHEQRLETLTQGILTRPEAVFVTENIGACMANVAENLRSFVYAGFFNYAFAAAAIYIAEKAGCICTDFNGGKEKLITGEELFCSNKAICQLFQETK